MPHSFVNEIGTLERELFQPHIPLGSGAFGAATVRNDRRSRNQAPAKPLKEGFEKMNRSGTFNSPFLLGFEHLERLLERTAKAAADGYPPYNIEDAGGDRIKITLAVAGFGREDLHITVEDNQLVIRGKQNESGDRTFLHRGIAARQFQRAFVLAEGIEVTGAELENGLLSIGLARPKPETAVRTIEIRTKPNGKTGA